MQGRRSGPAAWQAARSMKVAQCTGGKLSYSELGPSATFAASAACAATAAKLPLLLPRQPHIISRRARRCCCHSSGACHCVARHSRHHTLSKLQHRINPCWHSKPPKGRPKPTSAGSISKRPACCKQHGVLLACACCHCCRCFRSCSLQCGCNKHGIACQQAGPCGAIDSKRELVCRPAVGAAHHTSHYGHCKQSHACSALRELTMMSCDGFAHGFCERSPQVCTPSGEEALMRARTSFKQRYY